MLFTLVKTTHNVTDKPEAGVFLLFLIKVEWMLSKPISCLQIQDKTELS